MFKARGKWEESNEQRLKSLTKNLWISLTEQVPEKVCYGLGDKQTNSFIFKTYSKISRELDSTPYPAKWKPGESGRAI